MWDTTRIVAENIDLDPGRLMAAGWKRCVTTEVNKTGSVKETTTLRLTRDDSPHFLSFSPLAGSLVVETSLPKILFHQNVSMLSPADVPKVLDELSNRVNDLAGSPLPHCRDWHIRGRLDACFCWNVGQKRVPDYLHSLSQMQLARHHTDYVDNAKTVYWKTARRWLRSYDKYEETHLPQARGILRFEVEMKRAKSEMQKVAGVKEDATVGEMLNWENAERVLSYWLDRLGTDLCVRDDERLFGLLVEKCGRTRAIRLMGFIFASRLYGRDELTAQGFKRDYLWRNSKAINSVGASVASTKSGLLPGLMLPEKYDGRPGSVKSM